MNYDEWNNKYHPINNDLDDEAMLDTLLLPILLKIDKHFVWTVVDGENDKLIILPGFHYVNRLGYYATDNPWEDKDKNMEVIDSDE